VAESAAADASVSDLQSVPFDGTRVSSSVAIDQSSQHSAASGRLLLAEAARFVCDDGEQ
jgi:hypothetical protein